MKQRFSIATVVIVGIIALALAPLEPATAVSDGGGDAGLSPQARSAAQLDTLRASDAQLTQALTTLDQEVVAQQNTVASAQQAFDAANQSLALDDQQLAEVQDRMNGLKSLVAQRAVSEFVHPQDQDIVIHALSAADLADVSSRNELLRQVNNQSSDAIEELAAAKIELSLERKAADQARKVADDRRQQEQKKLDDLKAAHDDKTKLDAALNDRIQSYTAEDTASASQNASSASTGGRASRGSDSASGNDARQSTAGLQWPVEGPIRSPFGMRWGSLHTGIDIGAPEGTPIHAAKGGTVVFAGTMSGYGNVIDIDNGGGLVTRYAHQSRLAATNGQTVSIGDLIGYVGHTGHVVPDNVGAAHLHFETRINGQPQDPMQYLP